MDRRGFFGGLFRGAAGVVAAAVGVKLAPRLAPWTVTTEVGQTYESTYESHVTAVTAEEEQPFPFLPLGDGPFPFGPPLRDAGPSESLYRAYAREGWAPHNSYIPYETPHELSDILAMREMRDYMNQQIAEYYALRPVPPIVLRREDFSSFESYINAQNDLNLLRTNDAVHAATSQVFGSVDGCDCTLCTERRRAETETYAEYKARRDRGRLAAAAVASASRLSLSRRDDPVSWMD